MKLNGLSPSWKASTKCEVAQRKILKEGVDQWFSTFSLPRTTQRCYIAVAYHQVIEDFNLLKIYCKIKNTHNDNRFNVRVAIIFSQSVDQCGVGPSSRHIGSHVQVHKDDSDP